MESPCSSRRAALSPSSLSCREEPALTQLFFADLNGSRIRKKEQGTRKTSHR